MIQIKILVHNTDTSIHRKNDPLYLLLYIFILHYIL